VYAKKYCVCVRACVRASYSEMKDGELCMCSRVLEC
jgi:hypothetical protein